ncbi:MAG TPA: hypothetical protein VIM34_09265 [Burkholderiaceae bacterium]
MPGERPCACKRKGTQGSLRNAQTASVKRVSLPARALAAPAYARAALTSALISSIDIGAIPAAATRSAIDSSESAACWRFSASVMQAIERLRRQQPRGPRSLRGGIGQFDLNRRHGQASFAQSRCVSYSRSMGGRATERSAADFWVQRQLPVRPAST